MFLISLTSFLSSCIVGRVGDDGCGFYVYSINSEMSFGKGDSKHYESLYHDEENESFKWTYRYEYPEKSQEYTHNFTFYLNDQSNVTTTYKCEDFVVTCDEQNIIFEDGEYLGNKKYKYKFKGGANIVISYKDSLTAIKDIIKRSEYKIQCTGNDWHS